MKDVTVEELAALLIKRLEAVIELIEEVLDDVDQCP